MYLTKIPHVLVLKLEEVHHMVDRNLPTDFHCPVHLEKLVTLELGRVLHPSTFLCGSSAPSLQTLTVRRTPILSEYGLYRHLVRPEPLSSFFTQWSSGAFLPSNLRTLILEDCLQVQDVAFLIRWLGRLPSLVRLTLWDPIAQAVGLPPSDQETNIFCALASSEGEGRVVGGWLCPSLTQLRSATDVKVTSLIPLARARGGRCAEPILAVPPPNRLRYLEAPSCTSGFSGEIEWLKGLVDEVRCGCFGCQFSLARSSSYSPDLCSIIEHR